MGNRKSVGVVIVALVLACIPRPKGVETYRASKTQQAPREEFDDKIGHTRRICSSGADDFPLRHLRQRGVLGRQAAASPRHPGEKLGGVGAGLTPKQALKAGLKVDVAQLPQALVEVIQGRHVNLDEPGDDPGAARRTRSSA